jgi:hypothetical protein
LERYLKSFILYDRPIGCTNGIFNQVIKAVVLGLLEVKSGDLLQKSMYIQHLK